ncbi:MBL fold metallo-hydrolase, partial [Scytonema millei VB511283]|nr:MBL fold metallo-hydrolase [Scytonema millei VB511283]
PKNLKSYQQAVINAEQEFELEVLAEAEGAWLRVPESVVESDPRWQKLAGNGVVKAKWEGVSLRLCAANNLHLVMKKEYEEAATSQQECCVKCQYFNEKSGCCECGDSPLAEHKVDPRGYCLEYIPRKFT